MRGVDRDRLKVYLEQGLSLIQIGALENRDPSTVGYWVRKHGLEANGRDRTRHAAASNVNISRRSSGEN
jgi:hypothetical protein